MTPFFLSIFPALFRLDDLSKAISQWISKAERVKRWASERAAIKAEVTQAKETVDLLRMAWAITRLDALDAEIDACQRKAKSEKSPETEREASERATSLGGRLHDTKSFLRRNNLAGVARQRRGCIRRG